MGGLVERERAREVELGQGRLSIPLPRFPSRGGGAAGSLSLVVASSRHTTALAQTLDRERSQLGWCYPLADALTDPTLVARYLAASRRSFLEGSALPYLILDGDQVIGEAGLELDALNRGAVLTYWLARQWQGRGIAIQACRLLLGQALPELARVQAETVAGNIGSEKLLRRLGFQREGVLRHAVLTAGSLRDVHVYGLLAAEYRSDPVRYGAAAKA